MTPAHASLTVPLVALLATSGCRHEAETRRPPARRSEAMAVALIPPAPVAGRLAGQPFRLRTAWYRVQRRPGRERVDLVLSEGARTRLCSESAPDHARHVWLRFPGVTALRPGEQRLDPPSARPFSVHYERVVGARWRGHGGGSAVVAFDSVQPSAVAGRLEVCFGDAAQSCVAGSFHAAECWSELDLDSPVSGGASRSLTQ